jgi:hypothetical protein
MWVGSDRFWKMVEAIAIANERVRELEKLLAAQRTTFAAAVAHTEKEGHAALASAHEKIAAMQSTQDWLMLHVNRLENERRLLTEQRLHVSMPMPVIERDEPEPDLVHGVPHDALPLAQVMTASLEDVGDELARRLGIEHDEAGQIRYTQ